MAYSTTSIFGERDDFQVALCDEGGLNHFVTTHGQFQTRLTQVNLDGLRLSAIEERLPRIGFMAVPATKILVSFPIADAAAPAWSGTRSRKDEIMVFGPGYRGHMRTPGHCRWGTIWFPAQELTDYFRALTEHSLTVPPVAQRWRPPSAARRRLLQLHRAAIRAAQVRPEGIVSAEVAHGMEQQLIEAIVECLTEGQAVNETSATRRHQEIVIRLEDKLQSQPDRRPHPQELSAAVGVSEQLLCVCCKDILGMSPTRYVRLRALYRVRRSLRCAEPGATRVSLVARRHGFRALGRFAATYRALFGELPSARLRRGLRR